VTTSYWLLVLVNNFLVEKLYSPSIKNISLIFKFLYFKQMLSRPNTFILFSLTVVFILVAPDWVQHGMFMDGVQYACVAKNLALGKGSFWHPYLSASWQKVGVNDFLEHPPLSYFLQSLFFRVFGAGVFTENIYCLAMLIFCVYFIYRIWKLIFQQDPVLSRYWWLAVLLWFATPSVFWSFRNNMIENTVSVMVLAATYFALKAICLKEQPLLNCIFSGIFIFSGSLCKGFPALFPISILICWYACFNALSLRKFFLFSFILIALPAVIYGAICLLNEDARDSLNFYLENRLFKRVTSDPTVENRFTILFWLLSDQFVNIGITLLLFLWLKWRTFSDALTIREKKFVLFFFLYGLSGVIPLCLTHVQRAVYFVPALPFFAFGFAIFLARGIDRGLARISDKRFRLINMVIIAFFVFSLIFTFMTIGTTGRDEKMLEDTHTIGAAIGKNKRIGTTSKIYNRWDFQFYLLRYDDNVLFTSKLYNEPVLILDKGTVPADSENYALQKIQLNNDYCVYIRR
jgi:hypothetical protein